jgi:hypothetical protein
MTSTSSSTGTGTVAGPEESAPAGWAAGTWAVDPAHTCVKFAVRHLMSRVHGPLLACRASWRRPFPVGQPVPKCQPKITARR